jgi:magnesium transporter
LTGQSSAARIALARSFVIDRPVASAETLEDLEPEAIAKLLADQPADAAARVLEAMRADTAARVMLALGDGARAILGEMSPPLAIRALRWLDGDESDAVLARLSDRVARELRDLFSYPGDSAGALMDPRIYTARPGDTAAEARERLAGVAKPLYQMYVVDGQHRCVGAVPLQKLAAAGPAETIGALMTEEVESIDAFTHRDEVAELLGRTATPTIAVVDAEGHLIGALRHRALLGIAEEEAAAMMQRMVGVSREEGALSPVGLAVRKRLPWLNINLLTAFLAAAVVGLFEGTIARVTSLAILLPVVAGQSGNSGSQALAVTMRGLALREIRSAHWPRVAFKELFVGTINGLAIAVVTGVGVWIWSGSIWLAGVIAMSMVASMAAAGIAGASVPIVLKSLGQDPAQSSSIILTTVTDVVGFSSFLGIATLLADRLV